MDNTVGDIPHCEEQLRTTLHCDDKDKLRKKLLLLKREYLRTAQRLQRAERSEAVRRHVRSRTAHQQKPQEERELEVTDPSLTRCTINGKTSDEPQDQGQTGGPKDNDQSSSSQVIRSLRPSDAAQTTDPIHDSGSGNGPSAALRLRSRLGRLRLERRSADSGESKGSSKLKQGQNETTDTPLTETTESACKTEETDVVSESEELCSDTDSESPSLLLTHWNTCGRKKKGCVEKNEMHEGKEQSEKGAELTGEGKKEAESKYLLLTCHNPDMHTDGRGQDGTQKEGREDRGEGKRRGTGRSPCQQVSINTEQISKEQGKCEKSNENTVKNKEDKSEMVQRDSDKKGESLLDSCTLVEGLIFPAEYYVRTTRRMTSSQSQPDMQAVILTQLNIGRHHRSRGRGRRSNSHKEVSQHPATSVLSPATQSASVGPCVESQDANTATELNGLISSDSSVQISALQINMDAGFCPAVSTPRQARGRRRRRGRGRGRPQTPRCSYSLKTCQEDPGQTLDDLHSTSSLVPSSPSICEGDGAKPPLTVEALVDSQPVPSSNSQPFASGGASSSAASGHQLFPIFQRCTSKRSASPQIKPSPTHWRSLLLPSSPPIQTPLLPLPSLSSSSLVNSLINFDIPQDFHLPDDQFASLKLHKLHQIAVETGLEHFTSPSYNTRRSIRRYESCHSNSDPLTPHSLPFSPTPTISDSPSPTEVKQTSMQSVDLQKSQVDDKLPGAVMSQTLPKELTNQENPEEQQTSNIHLQSRTNSNSSVAVSVVQEGSSVSGDQCKDKDVRIPSPHSQNEHHDFNTHGPTDQSVTTLHICSADRQRERNYVFGQSNEVGIKVVSSEEQTNVSAVENHMSANHITEGKGITQTLSFDCFLQQIPEKPTSNTCTAVNECNNVEAPGESPVQHVNMECAAKDSKESPEANINRDSQFEEKCLPHHGVHTQLLLSPPLTSAPSLTPHLRSSVLPTSLTLPSLGLTPQVVPAARPLTSSPSAPALTLPPPHSPSTQALSPPAMSPCPSLTSFPSSQSPSFPQVQTKALYKPSQSDEPGIGPTMCRNLSGYSGGQLDQGTEETEKGQLMSCTHTLKSPAGGSLVDACCLSGSSGGLCVAAAGKWAVCLWGQTSASDWTLLHTWSFSQPVISVFAVPDAEGLICVTLGQLEIREVRMLSCSSPTQVLLCQGLVQAVVCVSNSRVISSLHSASGSTLQLFMLSESCSTISPQHLVSPGVCVRALAPVDGLPDALIGTDDGGLLFVWNLKTGQMLQRILLRDGFSNSACLRAYSYCGVLFVLLQHQLLSSLEEVGRQHTEKHQEIMEEEEEEKKRIALLSLVAVNPVNGKSVPVTRLYPPKAWSGRLCEADANSCSIVGLSQRGCVCVWELGHWRSSRMVLAPESEGWQLARLGIGGVLVTGHHNGDVTLHCCSAGQRHLCH